MGFPRPPAARTGSPIPGREGQRSRGSREVLDAAGIDALLESMGNHRDRLLVAMLVESGMRIGEALGLRTEDLHFFHDSRSLGCGTSGPHVHVRRRRNPNAALSKSARPRVIPVTATV